MKQILIVGGNSGVGKSLVALEKVQNNLILFHRSEASFNENNIAEYKLDVLQDELPDLESLDAIVYCPGSINLKPFSRLSEEDFRDDFEINVLGAIRVLKKYLTVLKKSEAPSVLLFSTVAVKVGMPFHTSVAASKGAVEGMVKSLAAEYAPKIRVNAIAPTLTDTALASKILRNEKSKEMSAERHPLKRYLVPDEVAEMASFLISDRGRSMSGQIVEMDCGITNLKV
ncbi:SDR family NAD(P)-dependent oxidoreductase [Flavicella marina]|uniref:SDR family NAD(P)-dependent oxidoreductase n=1 Tax=Flavicella marina TaxID=1475951 RepID=UPI00126506A4|nr:SDR family oxidoreductase [Flavicella marina]